MEILRGKPFAVVILNWNRVDHLKRYLPGVMEHLYGPGAHVVVADNGSRDGSLDWVRSRYPDSAIALSLDRNYGFAEGYNRALRWVRTNLGSPYYLILNNDARVEEDFLSCAEGFFAADSGLGVLAPKILSDTRPSYFEHAGAGGGFLDRYGYPFCRGRVLGVCEEDLGQYDDSVELHWASGAAFIVRAEAFWRVGGFDGSFFAHMEEIELCWRLRRAGYGIRSFPQGRVYHLGAGTLAQDSPRKLYLNYRNSLLMLRKNLPPGRRSLRVMRTLFDAASVVIYLLRGKWKYASSVARAYRDYHRVKRHYVYHPFSEEHSAPLGVRSLVIERYIVGRKRFSEIGLDSKSE